MRTLQVDGLGAVGRIGLGTWQFGAREWGYGSDYADTTARAIVRRALELGVTLFDTAEIYGTGRSERILGAALGADRERVTLASKIFPVAPFPAVTRSRARGSARRLGVRCIDLYQVHWPNPLVPDSVIMPGLAGIRDAGLIGAVGVSNYSLARWQRAERELGGPVVSNQVQFSLAHAGPAQDLVPWAAAHGRMVLAYSPLAQGLLGGRYDAQHRPTDFRATTGLFLPENLERAAPLLELVREVAAGHGSTPAAVSLAWLLGFDPVVVIPGAATVAQLEANVAAADLTLTGAEQQALTAAAVAFAPVTGVRAVPRIARTVYESRRAAGREAS